MYGGEGSFASKGAGFTTTRLYVPHGHKGI